MFLPGREDQNISYQAKHDPAGAGRSPGRQRPGGEQVGDGGFPKLKDTTPKPMLTLLPNNIIWR